MVNVTKSSIQVVKAQNMNMLFNLLHENETLSRVELKRMTGLSPTTVSSLIDELIEKDLVMETGILDTGSIGRKAVSLTINPKGRHFAGIEIDGERIIIDIYDLTFFRVYHAEKELDNYEDTLDFLVSSLKNLSGMKIYSIIIGFSGVLVKKGTGTFISTVTDISYEDLTRDIEKEFPEANVEMLNSSSLIAFAEKEERQLSDLISIDIGKGVGSGIIIDGKIYKGAGGTAGEFGHVSVNMDGPYCKCGNRGCTELYTNTSVIRKKAAEILGLEKVSLKTVRKEAEGGNAEIIKLLSDTAEILSIALVSLINMMAPESVVIGGKIKELGESFLEPLKKAVSEKCFLGETKIEFSLVSGNSATLGAAKYSYTQMLSQMVSN